MKQATPTANHQTAAKEATMILTDDDCHVILSPDTDPDITILASQLFAIIETTARRRHVFHLDAHEVFELARSHGCFANLLGCISKFTAAIESLVADECIALTCNQGAIIDSVIRF